MNDQELKALIREVVSRRLAERGGASIPGRAPTIRAPAQSTHASHALFLTLVNVGEACLIEPAVACNHCGYCKSQGY